MNYRRGWRSKNGRDDSKRRRYQVQSNWHGLKLQFQGEADIDEGGGAGLQSKQHCKVF